MRRWCDGFTTARSAYGLIILGVLLIIAAIIDEAWGL
jgi:hypothetical protein